MDSPNNQVSDQAPAGSGSENDLYIDRLIPIDLIDEPSIPERETMDAENLGELANRILEFGLYNRIIVFEKGERFETIAGHRRLLACRLAGLEMIPCRIRQGSNIDPIAIMIDENENREKVNPVEQARFYRRLLVERCGSDTDALCALVRRRREHVESRLLLLLGDSNVCLALEHGRIKMAVAAELNKIPDPGRRQILLNVAIESGATARQVAMWAKEGAALGDVQVPPADGEEPGLQPIATTNTHPMECVLCESGEHSYLMEMLYVHKTCRSILMRMLNRETPASTSTES